MKTAGAQEICATFTDAHSIRTMATYRSKEECEVALVEIKALASDAASMKLVGTVAGDLRRR